MNKLSVLALTAKWRLRAQLGLPYAEERELVYRLNRLPVSSSPDQRFRFPWGVVEYLSASDLRGQYTEIFLDRHYAVRDLPAEPVIIDAGGNIGMSAIWFKLEYPRARLQVFEADARVAAVLRRNLAAAGLNDVDVVNAAVWTEDGSVHFNNAGNDMGAVATNGSVTVAAIDLAAHLPATVDLLKLDIEGAEYPVVSKLCATGAIQRVRNLVAEYHVRRTDVDAFLESLRLLRSAGMNIAFTSETGPWLGVAEAPSAFELVGRDQILAELYAWRSEAPARVQS